LLHLVCSQPGGFPDAEAKGLVNPSFRVVIFIFFAISGLVPREAIRSLMFVSWDMHKFKIKKQDGGSPSIDGRVRLYIRIVKHPTNELCIHLDNEMLDAN
jgi:hypothetical protein